ncbi:hypothetical protein ABBQ32_005871 [Trebouxia sp. C0010 RCD-2024]
MPLVASSLKGCVRPGAGRANRSPFGRTQPLHTSQSVPGTRYVGGLALINNGGDGGGASPPPQHTAHNDGWHPPVSWQSSWLLLAVTAAGACWRDVTKQRSWTDYSTLPDRVSIIIPALNEEKCIADTLQIVQALDPSPHEVIVVDGGSTDRTKAIAAGLGVRVLPCSAGRAKQMNAGAEAATGMMIRSFCKGQRSQWTGAVPWERQHSPLPLSHASRPSDLLCFLHADTHPPHEVVSVIRGVMTHPNIVLAGFRTTIQTEGRRLHGMTFHHLVKTYYVAMLLRPLAFVRGIRCLFGDQTLFCRAADFKAIGGFQNDLPIMEDVDLCIRMHEAGPSSKALAGPSSNHRRGRVTMVMSPVNCTSGRRLSDWGAVQATLIHFYIALRWYFGASPAQMYSVYHQMYTDNHR